ncbi:MAG TPA: hypothetical protein PLR41_00935 [Alphaproteobacteria bacterium]|nr:hypothetical protein [Alphaproteobacteria bacterium]
MADAINLSPYQCGGGRVARPFEGLSLLLFAIAVPLSIVFSRTLFYRNNYLKWVHINLQRQSNLISFLWVSSTLFSIGAILVSRLLEYVATPCVETFLDPPMSHGYGRMVPIAIMFSLIGALFSDLIRYRPAPRRNP